MHCKDLHVIAKDKVYENSHIYIFDQANQCFAKNITFFHLLQTLVKIMYIYSKGIERLGTEL